jgi:2-polyprenyl-6-hydroxyphenyl methylase/3-demethylubiquinone-9 3-methyltransferase
VFRDTEVDALRLYRPLPLPVRLHTRIRAWTCPFAALLERVPAEGRLLEVGCGHGLFANAAALAHPRLQVLGVDPSADKIRWAQATVDGRPNVGFARAEVDAVEERGFDLLAVIDVLYLVPRRGWPGFLHACRERLRPGGRLLLKDVDVRPRWKFYRCVGQETLSVRLLGITHGHTFAFAGRDEMARELAAAGFAGVKVSDLGRGYLTPHVLYEAGRP